jgi:exodeoxyribonuclease X
MNIVIVDTETTGLDPATADIVELATVTVPHMNTFSTLVKPSVPIELQAMACHHITEDMVEDEASIHHAIDTSPLLKADVLVAHNAIFDKGFINKSNNADLIDKPWVCTWRCARHLWPDSPSHSNQVLRYWLPDLNKELYVGDQTAIMKLPPHRALVDAWVTAHIFKRMLAERSIDELIDLSTKPVLERTCRFGMHYDKPWSQVPKSYLRWMLNQKPGFDEDVVYTAKYHLIECEHCQNGCDQCNGTGFKHGEKAA